MTQVTIPGPHHYEIKVDSVIIRNNLSAPEEERFTVVIDRIAEPQDEQNNPVGPPIRLKSLYLSFQDIKNDQIPDFPQITVEQVFFLCMRYIQSKKGEGI